MMEVKRVFVEKKVLVLGENGQLAQSFKSAVCYENNEFYFIGRRNFDLASTHQIKSIFDYYKPNIIINTSAYTDVENAEFETEAADCINHLAIKVIAEQCRIHGTILIHISTDYVFDGEKKTPYTTGDLVNPLGQYGLTKLHGEFALKESGCRYCIIRTSWLFSEYGNNFLRSMLKIAETTSQIKVVADQIGCPTYAGHLVAVVLKILPLMEGNLMKQNLYHFAGDSYCSWYQFAKIIFDQASKLGIKVPESLIAVPSKEYPSNVKRPQFSALDSMELCSELGIKPSNWQQGIQQALSKIVNSNVHSF